MTGDAYIISSIKLTCPDTPIRSHKHNAETNWLRCSNECIWKMIHAARNDQVLFFQAPTATSCKPQARLCTAWVCPGGINPVSVVPFETETLWFKTDWLTQGLVQAKTVLTDSYIWAFLSKVDSQISPVLGYVFLDEDNVDLESGIKAQQHTLFHTGHVYFDSLP